MAARTKARDIGPYRHITDAGDKANRGIQAKTNIGANRIIRTRGNLAPVEAPLPSIFQIAQTTVINMRRPKRPPLISII
jgi:hypothetical protein